MIRRIFAAAVISLATAISSSPIVAQSSAARLEKIASTASDVDLGRILAIAASRSGDFFVIDGQAQQIVAYDSAGRRRKTIGRGGDGPLEFRGVSTLAWLADTLVALDWVARRLTYVLPDGKLLRTAPWTGPRYSVVLFGPGGSGLHALGYDGGETELIPDIQAMRLLRPRKTFLGVGADGNASVLTSIDDMRPDPLGSLCWGPSRNIVAADELPSGNGPFNAFTSRGDFVSLSPGRTQIAWQLQAIGPTRVAGNTYAPVAVTDAIWARETKEYIEAEKKAGKLTCNPPILRPATIPPIRSIVADDAGGLWVEVTTLIGTRYDIYDASGKLAGSVTPPVRRVQNIPFVVRGGKIYFAVRDADDVVSISVYRLRR